MDFERLIAALNDYVIVASVIAIRNSINCAALGQTAPDYRTELSLHQYCQNVQGLHIDSVGYV